jgi:hypothetical protein
MMAKKGLKAFLKGDSYTKGYLTSTVINMLAVSTTAGITMQLKVDSIEGFVIFVVLFTLFDMMIGLLIKRYLFHYVIQSLGLILALVGLILIFITERLVPDVYFTTVIGFIGFSVFFLVFRLLLIFTYERLTNKRGLK